MPSQGQLADRASPTSPSMSHSSHSPSLKNSPNSSCPSGIALSAKVKRGDDSKCTAPEELLGSPEKRLCTSHAIQSWQGSVEHYLPSKAIEQSSNADQWRTAMAHTSQQQAQHAQLAKQPQHAQQAPHAEQLPQAQHAQLAKHAQQSVQQQAQHALQVQRAQQQQSCQDPTGRSAHEDKLKAACQMYAATLRTAQHHPQHSVAPPHQHPHSYGQRQAHQQISPANQSRQGQQLQQQQQQKLLLQQKALADYQAALGRTGSTPVAANAASTKANAHVDPRQQRQQGQQLHEQANWQRDQQALQQHQQQQAQQHIEQRFLQQLPLQQQHQQTHRGKSEPAAVWSPAQVHNVYRAFQWQKDAIEFADVCNQQAAQLVTATEEAKGIASVGLHQEVEVQRPQHNVVPEVVKVGSHPSCQHQ